MKTTREALQATETEHGTSVTRGHPRERTGVRFVLTNAADSSQADDYSAWYDDYERAMYWYDEVPTATSVKVAVVGFSNVQPLALTRIVAICARVVLTPTRK